MKKWLIILTFCLVGVYVNAQNREYKEHYGNRQLKLIGNFNQEDQPTGEWKFYHENGQLSKIGKVEKGNPIGEWKFYHENAQLKETGQYDEQGKETGKRKIYHDNGKPWSIGRWKDGKRSGAWKIYHRNGRLQETGKYKNGLLTGEWKYYYENGKLKTFGRYNDNGEKTSNWITYKEDGKSTSIEIYKSEAETLGWLRANQGKVNTYFAKSSADHLYIKKYLNITNEHIKLYADDAYALIFWGTITKISEQGDYVGLNATGNENENVVWISLYIKNKSLRKEFAQNLRHMAKLKGAKLDQ